MRRALAEVRWIARGDIELSGDGATASVRVSLTFRPPHQVDIREAVAAVSILSLTEEERRVYRVRCLTLTDCNAEPR